MVAKLLEFDYEIHYKHEVDKIVVDTLFRVPRSSILPETPLKDGNQST